ncbi:MAG: hypothetical protein JW959_06915 [Pirellulales bacterium]|nr:hypothetical protein [Pirellulales bacterium]
MLHYSLPRIEKTVTLSREQYVVDGRGKRTGVLLSTRQYQKLMEDLHDLAVVAERHKEKSITLETMKRRLNKDGLL